MMAPKIRAPSAAATAGRVGALVLQPQVDRARERYDSHGEEHGPRGRHVDVEDPLDDALRGLRGQPRRPPSSAQQGSSPLPGRDEARVPRFYLWSTLAFTRVRSYSSGYVAEKGGADEDRPDREGPQQPHRTRNLGPGALQENPRGRRGAEIDHPGRGAGRSARGAACRPACCAATSVRRRCPWRPAPMVPGRKTAVVGGERTPGRELPRKAVRETKPSAVTSQMTTRFAAVLPTKMAGRETGVSSR